MKTGRERLELAMAVSELAGLLDIAGKRSEASRLRGDLASLATGKTASARDGATQMDRIHWGMKAVRTAPLPDLERAKVEAVVTRIETVLGGERN